MTDFSGQVLADKYRIDSMLRETASGSLYHGTHLLMDKPVVVKILAPARAADENNVKQFAQEARTVSHISHPNILNVTDYGADADGKHFIVLENADGGTLKEAVRRDKNFPLERAASAARQIAAGLAAAHAHGVIHPNLTSENVLLAGEESEVVKIFGFGSFETDESAGFDALSDAEYFAPEQFAAATQIDERSNVYSLGVIFYEMLAGEVPFTGAKPTDIMLKHEQEPPPPLSAFRRDLPNEINQVVLSALAKNPDLRYQTAKEFSAALNRVNPVSENVKALAATVLPVVEDNSQNNIWKTAFILLAGIAVLGAFFIYITQVKQTEPTTTLMTDANGQPVQPTNPSTGTSEQMLSNMSSYAPDTYGNSNATTQPGVLPGGDGYDPWSRGVAPPAGAPNYGAPYPVSPGGQTVYVDPSNTGSVFMPQDGNTYVMVPKNANTNVNTQPTPKGRATPVPANTQTNTATNTARPAPTPAANTATPRQTPAPKPTATPQPKSTVTP